jgi:hypothetical protein
MEINLEPKEKIFYKDDIVMVTQARYIVDNKTYAMRNISSISNHKIEKSRTGAIILLIAGFVLLFIKSIWFVGILFIVFAVISLFLIKDEYSVRIGTNAGEANSLESKDKAYIQKIVEALNEAVIHRG